MWVGINEMLSKQGGDTDTGITTLGAQNGEHSASQKRDVLVELYRSLGTPKTSQTFDADFTK